MSRPYQGDATAGPKCSRCGRTRYWHPDGSCHVFWAGVTPDREEVSAAWARIEAALQQDYRAGYEFVGRRSSIRIEDLAAVMAIPLPEDATG